MTTCSVATPLKPCPGLNESPASPALTAVTAPPGVPGGAFGPRLLATSGADLPFRGSNNEREVQRYLVGAEGDFEAFGRTARWDVYGQYGKAKLREYGELFRIVEPTPQARHRRRRRSARH